MNVLDLPGSALWRLDATLGAWMSAPMRLVIWGMAAASLSMGLYWLVSPQRRIGRLVDEQRALSRVLWTDDGAFADGLAMATRLMRLALLRLVLVLGPFLVAAAPVVYLIFWLDAEYRDAVPAPTYLADWTAWISFWEIPFFAALVAGSLLLKLAFRIR